MAAKAMLFEEFLHREASAGRLHLPLVEGVRDIHVHGHCHQKAFGQVDAVVKTLEMIPGARVNTIESSCCGMAGAFGYHRDTVDVSRQMAELDLLPAVRKIVESAADDVACIVADGTSCRHQILEESGVQSTHVAILLARHLDKAAQC